MLIEFTKKDPRAGMRVALEENVAKALIEAGNAKQVKDGEADEAKEEAPAAKKPAKKAGK